MVRSILYYILLVVFTLLCFIPFAVLFLLTVLFDRERVVLHWASRMWSYGIFRLCPWWRIRIEGAEKIDRSRPWVIVTNHQSMLDIGWVLWMHGDIPVERGSRGSAKQMLERCRQRLSRGTSVIVFPEGTRTKTGEIGRFKDGAFLVAKHAGVGIQPVVIDGTWSLNDGWRLRMPHTFRVKVLDALPAEYVASKEARELAVEMENRMRTAHLQMTGKQQ